MKGGVDNQRYIDLLLPHPSKERRTHSAACLSNSVGDPDPQDPHVFGLSDPLVRGMDRDPDPSLFSKVLSEQK